MDHAKYAALFLSESREHIGACNQHLGLLERDPGHLDAVHALFRAMHTVKGMAAMMGYAQVTELAHRSENLLDLVRAGTVAADAALVGLLTEAVDELDRGIEEAATGYDQALDFSHVLERLDSLVGPEATGAQQLVSDSDPKPASTLRRSREDQSRAVRVVVRPGAIMPGARATLALNQAASLGEVTYVTPNAETFEQERFDGAFSFWIKTDRADEVLEEAIQSVGDIDSVTIGDAARSQGPAAGGDAVHRARNMIRVDLRRLDALMSHVGELVVARNRLVELAAGQPGTEFETLSSRINRLVTDVQSEVIEARMTPVWQVFDRFPRAVRDLARELGKQVSLTVEGGDLEVDRSLLDEIGDPILHLLRNAIDHGIESGADRLQADKPEEGRLFIRCTRERDSVVIRVEDDGRGIDRGAILAKARQASVVDDETEKLTDNILLQVLGQSGFSTATKVTSVSGRGVGIDVVLTKIRGLGGSVEIQSEVGQGTTFILRLPLTLVIFRALLARVGAERYVLPMAFISETVEYGKATRTEVHGRDSVVLREEVLATADLRDVVGLDSEDRSRRRPCVVLEVGDRRSALLVDALIGQQEIVVEPFDPPSGMPRWISGATILADGTPALILDAAALV
jgi:two-component system chemotaxis sensor kinase CheA